MCMLSYAIVSLQSAMGLLPDPRPLEGRKVGDGSVDRLGAGVGVVHDHVVAVDRGVVQGMVGHDADDWLHVAVHARRRFEVVDRVLLIVEHDHPHHRVARDQLGHNSTGDSLN